MTPSFRWFESSYPNQFLLCKLLKVFYKTLSNFFDLKIEIRLFFQISIEETGECDKLGFDGKLVDSVD